METLKQNLVVIGLIVLAGVEVFSLSFTLRTENNSGATFQNQYQKPLVTASIPKLSQLRGPQIDREAAMIAVEQSLQKIVCSSLPVNLWVFLLMAFVVLLIFNFFYTFEQAVRPQWAWELGLTCLTLIGWYFWDGCRTHLWFPLAVIKFGLIVAILYVYLLEKKLRERKEEVPQSLF